MQFPSKEVVERIRSEYPAGTRVELVRVDDPQAPPVGTKGTVKGVEYWFPSHALGQWPRPECGLWGGYCEKGG